MNRRLFTHLAFALLFLTCPCFTQAETGQNPKDSVFPLEKTIPGMSGGGLEIPEQTLTVTEKDGWLVASLVAAPDELEWQIVLAKIDPKLKPVFDVDPQFPVFSVQYGPYFVRETMGRLRVFRQSKEGETWPTLEELPSEKMVIRASRLLVVKQQSWYWICTSPNGDLKAIDALIRFQHEKLRENGCGGQTFCGNEKLGRVFQGKAQCQDEGDLLMANRCPGYLARAKVAQKAIKESLIGKPAPEISGSATFPAEGITDLEKLKGKVVLVDFWAAWCGPCCEKLPEVNRLYEKYHDQGLEVVGVHSSQNADGLEAFLEKNPLRFPVVLDDGETVKKYANSSFPHYFLIGRDGMVTWGFSHDPPSEKRIEAELAKKP